MDISSVSSSNIQQTQDIKATAALEVQKKAEQVEKQNAAQAIESVPDTDDSSNSGKNIDTFA